MPDAQGVLQPKSTVVSLFGGWLVQGDNWIAVADLLGLLEPLGIPSPGIRTAIGRLKKEGLLESQTRETVAGYQASHELLSIFEQGEDRIFASEVPAKLDDGWILAIFSVPESQREQRRNIRAHLGELGFGPINAGVFMAPARALSDAEQVLKRNDLDQYVQLFSGEYLGFDEISNLVDRAWDQTRLAEDYRQFVADFGSAVAQTQRSSNVPEAAFHTCMRALEAWRPLPYRDPGLPDEVQDFSQDRTKARQLFASIGSQLKADADRYVLATLGQDRG